jgi:hypothetical protein
VVNSLPSHPQVQFSPGSPFAIFSSTGGITQAGFCNITSLDYGMRSGCRLVYWLNLSCSGITFGAGRKTTMLRFHQPGSNARYYLGAHCFNFEVQAQVGSRSQG